MGVTRPCAQSDCRVEADPKPPPTNASCHATAYASSYGGRPSPVALPPRRRGHLNAVVFMENDARTFAGNRPTAARRTPQRKKLLHRRRVGLARSRYSVRVGGYAFYFFLS
jgi:hypothetical protein